MEKIKKNINYFNTVTLFLFMLFFAIGTTMIAIDKIDYLKYSNYLHIFGIISFILYIITKILKKEKILFRDIIIVVLTFFDFLSYIFAYNKEVALIGEYSRYEGLYSLITYYSIFLLSTTITKKNQKLLLTLMVIIGIYEILVGSIQILRISNIFGYDRSRNWSFSFKYATGTLGNPNFYSTYILICLLYVFSKLLKVDDTTKLFIYLFMFIFFIYGLIIGNTVSCLLAFAIILLAVLIKKVGNINLKSIKNISYIIISCLLICLALIVTDSISKGKIKYAIDKNFKEFNEILSHGITDETGNYRVLVWKKTLKKVPQYIYTGIGIDNFGYIDDGERICVELTNKSLCFDKVHNEYLQILITEGIFRLIAYLVFISWIIYINVKQKKNFTDLEYGIFLGIIGYLIQALFNISVISVAPIFYMLLGFSISEIYIDEYQ